MGLKKSAEKLDAYFDRLRQKKVKKIEPGHVSHIIEKLQAKENDLLREIEHARKTEKIERLKSKLQVVREQIRRGEWLKHEIEEGV
jgi:hypothetical protein